MNITSERILAHLHSNGASSRRKLCEALNIESSACTKNIQSLRKQKRIYLASWEKYGKGDMPLYDIGNQPDAPPPFGHARTHSESYAMPVCTGEPKKCTCCGESFPQSLEYFGPLAHLKDGLDTHCRPCRRKKNKNRGNDARVVQQQKDNDMPNIPVLRINLGDGRTIVRFGRGWKSSPAQRHGNSAGYASALSRNMEAPG